MSQPANDDFSQHLSDGEESNHEDASDTGTAPKQQQQVIPQTTAISNIKLPILKKEEYDIWAMEIEHYLEYIDNEVWKVIQNGNSKKRISIGKDGVVRVLSPVTAAEIQAVEKERKAKNILLMAIPKEHMRRFHGMDDAKEIWEAIRTRFGGNANSKKMQKAVFKQQFEAFKISNSEGLEKGYDRFQQLLSQLEAHGAEVSTEDANHKFLRSLPSAWSNLAMTMRTNPEIDNLSIDDLYNNLRVFEQEIQVLALLLLLQPIFLKKKVVSSLDFQEEVDTGAEQVNTVEGVSTGSTKLSTGSKQVSTVGDKKSASSPDKGQREGKAPMISEETPKKSKEQILQEEASLAEAIRLDTLQKEEVAKQVHLDSLLAQRIAEEEELNEQQKKRKAQVQFEAQHYTNKDWDLIGAKIESNAELQKACKDVNTGEDLQRKLIWKKKKTNGKERIAYTWDAEPTKKSGKRRKQIARKGLHTDLDKNDSENSDEVSEQDDFVSDDLTELYRIVMNRYGMDGPEDELEKVFWKVHYLNLESIDIYMLIERTYPLSVEICKAMLDKKLQGGKPDENCYKMLKMMEKQAGIRK
ncbi:hypothetical protein Tco_1216864 [Tanacetum coccineum]